MKIFWVYIVFLVSGCIASEAASKESLDVRRPAESQVKTSSSGDKTIPHLDQDAAPSEAEDEAKDPSPETSIRQRYIERIAAAANPILFHLPNLELGQKIIQSFDSKNVVPPLATLLQSSTKPYVLDNKKILKELDQRDISNKELEKIAIKVEQYASFIQQ